MSIKDRIQALCKEKNMTSKQLEEMFCLGKGYISKVDKCKPNLSKIQPIAEYFGVTIDYIMSDKEKSPNETYYLSDETTAIAQDIFNNKDLRLLFDAARDAKPEDLQTVHSMLLALKRKEQQYDD